MPSKVTSDRRSSNVVVLAFGNFWSSSACMHHYNLDHKTGNWSTYIIHYYKVATCLNTALGCNDAIDWCFGEGIELLVVPPHEVWLEQVSAVAVVLKFTLV